MTITLAPLPPYPSTPTRASLSPSQHATLIQTISSALTQVLSQSDRHISAPATLIFLSSYVKDHAQQSLQSLVWEESSVKSNSSERKLHHAVFMLAERLAPLGLLDLQTLLDLSVTYARVSLSRLRALFSAAFLQTSKASSLVEEVQRSAVSAFTALLASSTQGLYGLRKTTHILLSFLRPAPPAVTRIFARNKILVRALASTYHAGLASVAQTYGGLHALSTSQERELDEWERLFITTKVALLDAFHILVRTLLDDVASVASAGPALAAQAEPAFEVVFDLLDLPAEGGAGPDGLTPTPFLNRSLLADYQHGYDFSRTLVDVLRRTEDARADILESTLRTMSDDVASGSRTPGALKLIIRSSGIPPGIPPGIDNLGRDSSGKADVKGKGKDLGQRVDAARGVSDEQLDAAVSQVLDLLPEQDPGYVRHLLSHSDYPYEGDAERLIGALLEGTAPSPSDVEAAIAQQSGDVRGLQEPVEEFTYTRERRNVFDNEVMDLSKVKIGKKNDTQTILEDRSFIEQMKADILRRAEEMSDDEDEDDGEPGPEKGRAIAFEEELDDEDVVKVRDGDESDVDEVDEDESNVQEQGGHETPRTPETVLELAYIQDPKLFDRDGQMRRSKARADLKAQTGWGDEQIEGWRIMLEREPKRKERMLAKHEFRGNQPTLSTPMDIAEAGASGSRGGGGGGGGYGPRGNGRGRGRGRGRGGGRGGGSQRGGGGGDGDTARERAWKDKNKARGANHDRKRGHDKKMARGGGPS